MLLLQFPSSAAMLKVYLCPHFRLLSESEVLEVVYTEGGRVLPILLACKVYVAPGTGLWFQVRVTVLVSQDTSPVKLVA